MLLPLFRVANTILVGSTVTHDMAVEAVTRTTEVVLLNDQVPEVARKLCFNILSVTVLLADDIGHTVLRLYWYLIEQGM